MVLNQVKRLIIKNRVRFFIYEIAVSFLLIFFLSTLEWSFLPIKLYPEILGMLFYVIRLLIVFLAIPTTIFLMKKLMGPVRGSLKETSKTSTFKSHFMLYKVSKSNYKYQILYGFLLLFLVFIPLNFFLYLLIPEMFLYHSFSLVLALQNSYLLINNFITFFILLIVIQSCIAFTEETIYRGFVNKRGSEHFNQISAVLISAYFYSFLSFLYYLDPIHINFNFWFPIVWFFTLFLIGLILSLITIRKKWLFPSIFAHSISNIIMVSMIWCFLEGWDYFELLLFIYLPLLGVSLILSIWQYNRIRESVSIGLGLLKIYLKNNEKKDERNSDKYFRILFDIVIGFLIFLIGLLITI